MNATAATRRTVLIGATALAACANTGPVALDRQALAGLKRIAVPAPGIPAQPAVQVVNGVNGDLGILGRIAGDAARDRRAEVLAGLLAAQRFDASATLRAALTDRLRARGFTPVPQGADPARQAFLPSDQPDPPHDATLDVFVRSYGFTALSESSSDPFRPTVSLAVRLSRASDAATLLRDDVALGTDAIPGAITFPTFVRIEDDPARAAASLRQAMSAAADAVMARLA